MFFRISLFFLGFLSNDKEFSGEIFCITFRKVFHTFTIEFLPIIASIKLSCWGREEVISHFAPSVTPMIKVLQVN